MKQSIIGVVSVAMLAALSGCSGQGEEWDADLETSTQDLAWSGLTPTGTVNAAKEVASCVSGTQMLVAGGTTAALNATSFATRYDTSTNSWLATEAIMNDLGGGGTPRAGAKLIKVPGDDKCVLIGGFNNTPALDANIYVYDFSLNDWDDTGIDLANPRYGFDVAFLSNTQILVVGGDDLAGTEIANIERVTISGGFAVANLANLSTAVTFPSVVARDDGRTVGGNAVMDFYVIGGETGTGAEVTNVERIGVRKSTSAFEDRLTIDSLPENKSRLAAFNISGYVPFAGGAKLTTAKILAAAGVDVNGAPSKTSYALELPSGGDADGEWRQAKSMTTARIRPEKVDVSSVTGMASGDVLIVGGSTQLPTVNGEASVASDQSWDDSDGLWFGQDDTVIARTNGFALQVVQTSATPTFGAFASHGTSVNGASPPVQTFLSSIEQGL